LFPAKSKQKTCQSREFFVIFAGSCDFIRTRGSVDATFFADEASFFAIVPIFGSVDHA